MLLIKTYLGQSKIHGIGLFANEKIKKGQTIWVYNINVDLTFSPIKYRHLISIDHKVAEIVNNFAYKQNGNYVLCTDNMRHCNNDFNNPNVGESLNNPDIIFALRDIEVNEEITCDYRLSSDKDDHHVKMLCKEKK